MRSDPIKPGSLAAAAVLLFLGRAAPADETLYVNAGSSWKYFRGLSEASSPDPAAWRKLDFDDSGWASGPAPFGYGEPALGTDLALLSPPMQGSYSTLFLRQKFTVPDASRVASLEVGADHDDGFILWLNGKEALRVNVPGETGDPVSRTGLAAAEHESGGFEAFVLADPVLFLQSGANVAAVQVFNRRIDSDDLKLDLEVLDPFGPDRTPPVVVELVPAAGATVRGLSRIDVTFSEEVSGVGAADLLIGGAAAAAVSGSGRGPYLFTFGSAPAGVVELAWAPGHGIRDLADPPNAFGGGKWTCTVDPAAPSPSLVLNELLAWNRNGLLDEDREPQDWIEVLNRGPQPVNLLGYGLTDEPDEPGKWTFPDLTLAAGQYLVVFASGKDRKPTGGGRLHTSFKLSAAGEYLGLTTAEAPRRVVMEIAPQFPEQRADFSYGLDSRGLLGYFDTPTPGGPNSTALVFRGFVAEVKASAARGFYQAPLSLELTSATPGASIRYTLDGSEPSSQQGTLYTGPLQVAGSPQRAVINVRAVAYLSGYLPSNVTTFTYIFPDQVLAQPAAPAGFPAVWGTAPAVDYGMDPEIVNNALYHDRTLEALTAVPTVSVVMDRSDLFGSGGIYSNPEGQGVAWERPASAELIYPDGRKGFQINCGIRIQGGASRLPVKSPKHSLRLLFKSDYGPSKLEFPLFGPSAVDSFDVVVLRAGFNNTWIHWASDQRNRAQYIHDQFARDTQLDMGRLSAHGSFVNVYLDGLYWGLYNLTERPEASFAASYQGGEKEEYDALNAENTLDGDRVAWNTMLSLANAGLSSEAQYQAIQQYLDVPNLIDYMIMNIYGANQDWPSHNWYVVRRRQPGAGYRFFSWDAERTLEDTAANRAAVSDDGTPARLYSQLRANAEFRLLFADRLHRHFQNGGAMTAQRTAERWMARAEEIDVAVVGESARWGDYRRDVHPYSSGPYELYTRDLHWAREETRLLNQYFPQRSTIVLNQFRSLGLYPAVGAPVFNQQGGPIQPGFSLIMSLPAGASGAIYYALDGTDPRVYGTGAVSPSAALHGGPLVLTDSTWVKARTLNGVVWSALNEATFTVPAPFSALRLSEIHYNPLGGSDYEFLELVNTGSATLDLAGLRFTEGIDFTFPAPSLLRPGEYLVLAASAEAFAAQYPEAAPGGVYLGRLDNGGERFTLQDSAGNELLSVHYDDEGLWPVAPDGFGYSLVAVDPSLDPADPRSWRASARAGGSPGAADPPPPPGGVVVNEVLARGDPPLEDAVELHNTTGRDVEIGGWYLSDSRTSVTELKKFRIPAGTVIEAGGYAVFYEYQLNPSPGVWPSFGLGGAGGAVYLAGADGAGNLTGYLVGAQFDGAENGVSFGRYVTSAGIDFAPLEARTFGFDLPASREEFRAGAGKANAPARVGEVVLNEVMYHPAQDGDEWVELYNRTDSQINLYDAVRAQGWKLSGVRNASGTDDYQFGPQAAIGGRGYLLLVAADPAAFRSRYGLPAGVPIHGPFGGALDNGGERLRLLKPDPSAGPGTPYVLVDLVRYDDRAPWPGGPDGGGPSLERILASRYGNDPVNWDASRTAGGSPGSANSQSPPQDNQFPIAAFSAAPLRGQAPLEVNFDASLSYDPDGSVAGFEWSFGDGSQTSGAQAKHTYASAGAFTATLLVRDDRGASTTAQRAIAVLSPGGGRVPGDANRDGRLDLSDAVGIILDLFWASAIPLPCPGGFLNDGGNRTLLDVNGDGGVDITDPLYLLDHLFRHGAPPVLGTACVPVEGCPELCAP